jgi:serine/threonine protein kinase
MKALPSDILPTFLCHAFYEEVEDQCSIPQHVACAQSRLPLHQEGTFSSCVHSSAQQQQQQKQQQRKAIVTRDLMAVIEAKEAIACRSPSVHDSTTTTKTFDDCYRRHALLGHGTFASVYLCQHRQNRHFYAVKELQVDYHHQRQQQQHFQPQPQHHHEDDDEAGDSPPPPAVVGVVVGMGEGVSVAHREIDALRRLQDGPFVVKLLDVFREEEQEQHHLSSTITLIKYYLILEQQQGGDLMELLAQRRSVTESQARKISRQLLEAIQFCHTKGIAHRDIKPENILLRHSHDETHIVLADFGSARRIPTTTTTTTVVGSNGSSSGGGGFRTLCGTPLYAAPEVFQAQMKLCIGGSCHGYNEQCDLWSAGVVIFALLGGYFPFDGKDEELPTLICEGTITWVDCYWDSISTPAKDLIRHLLQVSVSQRASVYDALDSPWLRRRGHVEHGQLQHEQSSCYNHGSCRWKEDDDVVEEKEEKGVRPSGVNLWYHHHHRNVTKQPPPPPCDDDGHHYHHWYDSTTTSPMDKHHDSFDSFTSLTTSSDSSSSSNSVLDLHSLASFVTQ